MRRYGKERNKTPNVMSTIINPVISAANSQLTPIIALSGRKKANRGGITGTTLNGCVEHAMTNTQTRTSTGNGFLTRGLNDTGKISSSGGEMPR